ncbi:hypothetical protein HPB51_027706 [Rhipicephalus microplus]|uniref:Uncharacterized protein n=1 Tax=Rhipicephalus microplus TaxID=6941 RepID=A0A9J6CZJ0_RHIMP|nr:hypothetical protein HPB51_027706 [Rhipicephalus microplus]
MFESPLRLRECSELLNQLKSLCTYLDDGDREVSTLSQITMVCNLLKELGANMDLGFEAQLDWCFAVFRNVSRDNQLGVVDRLRLIEVIELRSMGWKTDPAINEYYAFKYKKLDRRSAEDNNVLLEQQACVINQAQKSEQLFCEPVTKTRAPSARGTTVDLGGQLETPSVAHGETELWVRRITVGTEVAYVSGMSEGVVNMLTSAVQSLCPNVTADALLHTKQLPTLIPRDPAATLTGEVVASPMTYIQRSGDASDATSIQNTSDTSESQAEQFEGPGIQPSSTTQSQTVPLVDKSLGNTNGIGYAKQYGTHGSSIQFSSKAVEHVRHTDFHALGVGDLPAKKKQPGVLASSKELRSTDDHQAVVPHPPKAAGQSRPDRKVYTREFLLECLHSPLAFEMPPDFPRLDPLVEWAMVRKDRIY